MTTLISVMVVIVEFGLAGIIERCRVCQDRLHNLSLWQYAFSESPSSISIFIRCKDYE